MRTFSEGAVSSIVRALFKDRRDLSESIDFWKKRAASIRPGFDPMPTLDVELQENTAALVELAADAAPWIKQHSDWPLIANNLPTPRIPRDL
jgi:hypothetical protein